MLVSLLIFLSTSQLFSESIEVEWEFNSLYKPAHVAASVVIFGNC